MRITTTAVLAGVALVLSGVIRWVDRAPAKPVGETGSMLARFTPKEIDEITVKSSSGTVRLTKSTSGYWFFTEPVKDRVDPSAVAGLLDQLNHLAVLDQIERDEIGGTDQISAADMGLDAAGLIRVEIANSDPLTDPDAEEFSTALLIGKEAPLSNAVYARLPDSDDNPDQGVAVVDGNPRKYLVDPVSSLRDKRLLGITPDRLVMVRVKTARGDIEVQRKITPPTYPWVLLKPTETRANEEVLDQLVAGVGAIRVIDVIEEGDAGKIPNPIPDDSLGFELGFFGVEKAVNLFLKPHYDGGKAVVSDDGQPVLEAIISDRPARFLVTSDLLDKLPQDAAEFRNLHLTKIDPLLQQRIIIRSRTQPEIDLRSTPTAQGLQWSVMVNGVLQSANQGTIAGMIQAINDTKVVSYVSDSQARLPEFGLDRPATQVTFQAYAREGQKPEDTLTVLQLGRKADDEARLFANIIGKPYIYEVPADLQIAVPTHISNWKSLKLLSFNEFTLEEIKRIRPGEPTLLMNFDRKFGKWTVKEDGEDVTKLLNESAATTMRSRLGSLSATKWAVSLGGPYQALETPSTTFVIKVREFDPAIGEEGLVEHTLEFAPSNSEASYYGRLDKSNDVFHLDSKTYTELIRPMLISRDGPGK